jgi:ankyrin repeat protein
MFRVHLYLPLILLSLAALGAEAAGPDTALIDAARTGDARKVQALLRSGRRPNVTSADGTTPLHWAAYREDVALVDLLVGAGADIKAANRYGATPLSLAAANGNAAVIGRLLEAGADPNASTSGGETALMTASRTGVVAAVETLVARGADVNARESTRGQTALMWAAGEGHADVVRLLLKAGADLNAKSRAPAGAPMTSGSSTYRRSVARIDVFTPFMFAVRANRIDAVRVLLEAGADVNEMLPDGTSALVVAVHNAHYGMASFLLDKGADPNAAKQGWTALHQLMRTRNLNIGFFPHPEPTGKVSEVELARKLIAKGANVNARLTKPILDGYRNFWTQRDATPLLMAAKGADAEMMRVLAAAGADPSLTNTAGTTPLMAASGVEMFNPNEDSGTNEEAFEAVKLALELGGDVNQANKQGETPLHGAAWRGANEIVRLLVDRGANLTARNKAGLTPLQIANGEEEGRVANVNIRPWTVELMVKLMQERGLPIEMKTGDERFAFEKRKPRQGRPAELPQGLSPEDLQRLREEFEALGGQPIDPTPKPDPPPQR